MTWFFDGIERAAEDDMRAEMDAAALARTYCAVCVERIAPGNGVEVDGYIYCRDCAHDEQEGAREADTKPIRVAQ